jgi:hypothetical protein
VALDTVTLVTVMPEPKLTCVVPCAKWVNLPVTAIDRDWRWAEELAQQALDLDPNHAQARSLRTSVSDRKQQALVDECLALVHRLQAAGDLNGALQKVEQTLRSAPQEARLTELRSQLETRILEERRRQSREHDLEELRAPESEAPADIWDLAPELPAPTEERADGDVSELELAGFATTSGEVSLGGTAAAPPRGRLGDVLEWAKQRRRGLWLLPLLILAGLVGVIWHFAGHRSERTKPTVGSVQTPQGAPPSIPEAQPPEKQQPTPEVSLSKKVPPESPPVVSPKESKPIQPKPANEQKIIRRSTPQPPEPTQPELSQPSSAATAEPPPPTQPTTSSAIEEGVYEIHTVPEGLEIFIDGNPYGRSPIPSLKLTPGRHAYRVNPPPGLNAAVGEGSYEFHQECTG